MSLVRPQFPEVVFILVAAVLSFGAMRGGPTLGRYFELEAKLAEVTRSNEALTLALVSLERELSALDRDPSVIDFLLKSRYNLVLPGEQVVHFQD